MHPQLLPYYPWRRAGLVGLGLVAINIEVPGCCWDTHPDAVQLLGRNQLAAQAGTAGGAYKVWIVLT